MGGLPDQQSAAIISDSRAHCGGRFGKEAFYQQAQSTACRIGTQIEMHSAQFATALFDKIAIK